MKGIFSVLVENKAGVLSKTAGLFARRGFNIDSLAEGDVYECDKIRYYGDLQYYRCPYC